MYAGDTTDATQLAVEILGNSIDEYNIGHGNKIIVNLNENGTVNIEDYGQGFPINVIREDGETVLQASFDVINTSGKYREDGVYEGTAIGLNGIGSKLTNFLSNWLEVTSSNAKGEYEHVWFKEGVFDKREVGTGFTTSGTSVTFKPSAEFFDNPKVNTQKLRDFCEDITCLCPGLTIVFNNRQIKHDGIGDLLARRLGKEESILNDFLLFQEKQGKQKIAVAATYCGRASSNITAYVNCGLTTAGPHITGIKSCITRTLNKWAKEQGLLKEKEKNLEGTTLQEGLVFVCNITAENVAYDAQVKTTVTKIDTSFITSTLGEQLELWLDNNPTDGQIIIEKALIARRAAEAAKKARAAVKAKANAVPAKAKKTIDLPSKLADCFSTARKECEIYVVEGDSAGGNLKQVRNNEFQAVFPLRGKMLNTQKASLDKILKNAEIVNLIKAFGLQISADGKRVEYDKNSIRYGKIIIMSDADVDGAHIKNLFYTFIWNFIPDLIIDGFIYAGVPPLYRLRTNKNVLYLKDDEALERFKKSKDISKYQISRLKGLGEMSPEETEEALVNPETRIIEQITVEDTGKAATLFDTLMGSSAEKRKKYIEENSERAIIYV
jgi:DNA gyrase subunit B